MSQRNRQPAVPNLLPTEATPASFRKRLAGIAGLVVSATLATAIGSTTLTGLILGDEPHAATPIAIAPATQPVAPATQPVSAAAEPAPLKDVLPTINAHRPQLDESDLLGIGIDARIIDNSIDHLTSTGGRIQIVSAPAPTAAAQAAAVHEALRNTFAVAPSSRPQPVTFNGSPDLADAYRSFHAQAFSTTAYDQVSSDSVVSDTIPALGMDVPDTSTPGVKANGATPRRPVLRTPRRTHESDVSNDLTWETTVNARPNGELVPLPGAIGSGDVVDPFDGGGRHATHEIPGTGVADEGGGFRPIDHGVPGSEFPVDSVVPEPTSLLTLAAAAGCLLGRRRR